MTKQLEFFFDLSSPYSYLAATQVPALAARTGAKVAWKPFVLTAVFKASKNNGPVVSPEKARWSLADLSRWAAQYGVPFKMSRYWPINAIKAMRLICAADDEGKAGEASLAAFDAVWADEKDITTDDELRAIARAAELTLDPLAAIEQPAIKDRLRAYGDDAIRRGAFGAPAMFVGDELFWGNDRLHHVEAALVR
jgi:2-hydroxychromene-2-carboxylate isomerase